MLTNSVWSSMGAGEIISYKLHLVTVREPSSIVHCGPHVNNAHLDIISVYTFRKEVRRYE